MPPKVKITRDAIVAAAFSLLRESGYGDINARSLAVKLGCSTQPIFRAYENMGELKADLMHEVEDYFRENIRRGVETNVIPFWGLAIAYTDFARHEPNMFKLLFMADTAGEHGIREMLDGEEARIVTKFTEMAGINERDAKQLFQNIWFVVHGIACMLATDSLDMPPAEIEGVLLDGFLGFARQIKEKSSSLEERD